MRTFFVGLVFAALTPALLQAQASPFSVEGRVSAGFPTGDFADGATTGLGFGASAAYRVIPMLDLYAGYSWYRFGVDDDGELQDVDIDINDSGFSVGARLFIPMTADLQPWVLGGVLFHQSEISGSEGGIRASLGSDRGIGFEVGGGLAIPLTPNLSLNPAVRYRQYTATFNLPFDEFFFDDTSFELDTTYFSVDVGLKFRF